MPLAPFRIVTPPIDTTDVTTEATLPMTDGPYKVAAIAFDDISKLSAALNELHANGWEYQGHSVNNVRAGPPLFQPQTVAIVVLRRVEAPKTVLPFPPTLKAVHGE